jgi:hypothetical protein
MSTELTTADHLLLLGDAGQLAHDEEFRATPTRVEQLAGKRFVGGSANWLYTLLVTGECSTRNDPYS